MPGGGSSGLSQPSTPGYSLVQLLRYFLYLGSAGFGGPVALVEYMHRDLVSDATGAAMISTEKVWF
jgi:chromate transport protein ChrA